MTDLDKGWRFNMNVYQMSQPLWLQECLLDECQSFWRNWDIAEEALDDGRITKVGHVIQTYPLGKLNIPKKM